jgi:hypothetical protein
MFINLSNALFKDYNFVKAFHIVDEYQNRKGNLFPFQVWILECLK